MSCFSTLRLKQCFRDAWPTSPPNAIPTRACCWRRLTSMWRRELSVQARGRPRKSKNRTALRCRPRHARSWYMTRHCCWTARNSIGPEQSRNKCWRTPPSFCRPYLFRHASLRRVVRATAPRKLAQGTANRARRPGCLPYDGIRVSDGGQARDGCDHGGTGQPSQ